MEIKEICKLALDIKFALDDAEAQEIQEEFGALKEKLALLDKIDTSGVKEMIYPFDVETDFLRVDEVENVLNVDEALKNVYKTKQGHIVVPKVVK